LTFLTTNALLGAREHRCAFAFVRSLVVGLHRIVVVGVVLRIVVVVVGGGGVVFIAIVMIRI
jgi:hypothetical protein